MIREVWQIWMNRRGGAIAALRFALLLCLLATIALGGLSVHVGHAGPSPVPAHATVLIDTGNTGTDPGTMPPYGDCILHVGCQGVIPVIPLSLTAPHASSTQRPALVAVPDSPSAPPLPQPPNIS